jgi:hypothetical protein
VTISNSTISGNSAYLGGGIFGAATISNSTISNNTATYEGAYFPSSGAGVFGFGGTITNSIIAGNRAHGKPSDLAGSFTAASAYNLIGDAATAGGLANGVNGNIVGVDPLLGPLADNGGPTKTMALLAGSPAIDKSNNTLIPIGKRTAFPAPGAGHAAPRRAARHPVGSVVFAGRTAGVTVPQPWGGAAARRRWRVSFCRAAFRRDSSRRCSRTCSGWLAAQRSGSKASRSVSPALNRSSTSRT